MLIREFASIYRKNIKTGCEEHLENLLTIANPEYSNARRFSVNPAFGKKPDLAKLKFWTFDENNDTYTVPRNFHLHHPELFHSLRGTEAKNYGVHGEQSHYKFTGVLRDYQESFIDEIDFDNYDDLSLIAPAGTGKTIYGAYVTVMRKVKTLVCVPRNFLALQWLKAYETTTNLKCLVATDGTDFSSLRQLYKYDVIIMSFSLFHSRVGANEMPEGFLKLFGHFIADELHRIAAPTYMPVIEFLNTKYRTGLTATLRRGDGMHKIIPYHFGKLYTNKKEFEESCIIPLRTNFNISALFNRKSIRGGKKYADRNFEFVKRFFEKNNILFRHRVGDYYEADLAKANKLLKRMVDDIDDNKSPYSREVQATIVDIFKAVKLMRRKFDTSGMSMVDTVSSFTVKRNRLLLGVTYECLKAGRKVLFISKRKDALYMFKEYFEAEFNTFVAVQETMKKSDSAERLEQAQLILGISQITKEGLDVPDIDTIVLHLPVSDIEQTLGRCTRFFEGKQKPLIILPQDEYVPYIFMNDKARKSVSHKEKNVFHSPFYYGDIVEKINNGDL